MCCASHSDLDIAGVAMIFGLVGMSMFCWGDWWGTGVDVVVIVVMWFDDVNDEMMSDLLHFQRLHAQVECVLWDDKVVAVPVTA